MARDGFQISPHAEQRQYVDSLTVLLVVATRSERQNGHSVMTATAGWSALDAPVGRPWSGYRMMISHRKRRTDAGLDERCPLWARTQESVNEVYGPDVATARIFAGRDVLGCADEYGREFSHLVPGGAQP